MPLLELRDLLYRTGVTHLARMDDYQVRKQARVLLHSGSCLRNLADIRTVLNFCTYTGGGDRNSLQRLFDRALDMLDFRVEANKGLIYAGQYGTFRERWKHPDDRLTEEIRDAEELPSGAADKTTVAHTRGGQWLLPWNLRHLLGADGEDDVWAHATRNFIEKLSGEAQVLLPFREFDEAWRRTPWHPLYEVAGIKRVVYFMDDDSRQIMNPPKDLFTAGVAKKAFGLDLIFQAKRA